MLVHLRLTTPADLTERVVDVLLGRGWCTNVTRQDGVCLDPVGDLIEADVAREKLNEILDELDALGLDERGGIVVIAPSGTPFAAAQDLERSAPGDPADAVVWDTVETAAAEGARPTLSFQVFLTLAVLLAAIAVIQDSSILIVGAMVVGPEFTVIASACTGIVLGRWALVGRSLRLLAVGFVVAMAAVCLLALVGRATGVVEVDMVTRPRPQTGFIWHPDLWSFIVALVAGTAGALALAVARANIMVGVFISVTTVPAAGNLALATAFWELSEMRGSALQLVVNVAGMLFAGTLTLLFLRVFWTPTTLLWDRVLSRE